MSIEIIYIPLLEEGTEVFRPVSASYHCENTYKILESDDYDLDDEIWKYTPGTIVKCELQIRDGKQILVAIEAVR